MAAIPLTGAPTGGTVADDPTERSTRTQDLLIKAGRATGARRQALLEQAVVLNMCVAESIARRFRNRGEPLDDLVQVGCLGLTKAVRGFDPGRGHDFLSYAVPTISGEIKRHFRDVAWSIRPPRRIQELQARISGATAELGQQLGRSPRPSELAEHLEVDVEDVREALACEGCFSPSSLDDRGPGRDGYAVAERLGGLEPDFDRAEAVALLAPLCRQLKPRDRHIIFLRFFRGWTQERIAEDLGVTQMQVSRLLARILSDLRTKIGAEGSQPTGACR